MEENKIIRCDVCGKFIGYNITEVNIEFIPDTNYTIEETIFTHKKCDEKETTKSN